MHAIGSLVRMNLAAQRRNLRSFVVAAGLIIVIALFNSGEAAGTSLVLAVLPIFLPSFLFAADEHSHLDTLHSLLPVSRRDVVAARYATLGAISMLTTIAAIAISAVTSLAQGAAVSPVLPVAGTLVFAAVCVVLGVETPILFALGSARTGMYSQIAVLLVFFLGVFAFPRAGFAVAWALSPAHAGASAAGAVIVGVILLTASYLVSVRLYARRDL